MTCLRATKVGVSKGDIGSLSSKGCISSFKASWNVSVLSRRFYHSPRIICLIIWYLSNADSGEFSRYGPKYHHIRCIR